MDKTPLKPGTSSHCAAEGDLGQGKGGFFQDFFF
jgi:hypothetical protein